MSQTVCWADVTDEVRQLPSPVHDRIVVIMQSVDKRYRKLGPLASDPTGRKSRFTEWVNNGAGGHQVRVIGGTYSEEQHGPLRRVFGVLYDADPTTHIWTSVRLELLGIDHEHPEHRSPGQWNPANFERWYRDLRHAIVALVTTGDPATRLPNFAGVQLKAYVPPKNDWQPMRAFHDYVFTQLAKRRGGHLIHPPTFDPSSDWVDFEFFIDCS